MEPEVVDQFLDFQAARIGSIEWELVQAAICRFMSEELAKQDELREQYNALRVSKGKPPWPEA